MLSPCKFLSTSNYVSQSVSCLSSSLHSLERWLSYISVYHIHHLWEDGVPKGQEALSEFKMPEFNIFIGETDLHHCMGLTVNLPVGNEQRLLHLVSEENWFEQQLAVMYHFGVRSGHILQFSGILQMKADSWPLQSADSLPQCCCARFWNPNYLWRHTFVVELIILLTYLLRRWHVRWLPSFYKWDKAQSCHETW